MITKEILDAVNVGVLTDNQLSEAIKHYTELEKNLKCHGKLYHLVWKDVFYTLINLEGYKEARKRK